MIVHSDKIIGEWIEFATAKNSPILKDLWLLSDFIGGRKVSVIVIIKILDRFDQSKENVKILRRELGI